MKNDQKHIIKYNKYEKHWDVIYNGCKQILGHLCCICKIVELFTWYFLECASMDACSHCENVLSMI